MLHPHLAADDTFVARFRREAVAAARLAHPAIVSIYDTCSDDDAEAIVMELVHGTTLREYLDEHGALDRRRPSRSSPRSPTRSTRAHRGGHRPPRHQAGQHPAVDRRPGARRRLRHRQGGGGRPHRDRTRCSAPPSTSRPSRSRAARSTAAPTCTRSASCSTRCCAVAPPFAARQRGRHRARPACTKTRCGRATCEPAFRSRSKTSSLARPGPRSRPTAFPTAAALRAALLSRRPSTPAPPVDATDTSGADATAAVGHRRATAPGLDARRRAAAGLRAHRTRAGSCRPSSSSSWRVALDRGRRARERAAGRATRRRQAVATPPERSPSRDADGVRSAAGRRRGEQRATRAKAVDGDPTRVWQTEGYNTPLSSGQARRRHRGHASTTRRARQAPGRVAHRRLVGVEVYVSDTGASG